MARPPSENPKSEQVNVRLPADLADAFAAVLFVERTSAGEYVRSLVTRDVEHRLATDPLVKRAAVIQAEARLRAEGRLATMPSADGAS